MRVPCSTDSSAEDSGSPSELAFLRELASSPAVRPLQLDIGPDGSFGPRGRFILRRHLGTGGFGTVYEALDRERAATVALKVLLRENGAALYRFKQEFRRLSTLLHPNLVTLYELFSDGPRWFFTMELIQGRPILDQLRIDPIGDEPDEPTARLQPDQLRAALLQLCDGLSHLHRAGIVHRDIKPHNVMCTRSGRTVLLDFGLSKSLLPEDGSTGGILGTIAYMAPEQLSGEDVGPAADWYGVGALLYEALAGRPPYIGPTTAVLHSKREQDPPPLPLQGTALSVELSRLCMELLRRAPAERPTQAEILGRLSAMPSESTAMVRTHEDPSDELLGREMPLAALQAAFEQSQCGRPTVVLCHGASGIGKSALCRHFLRRLQRERGAVTLAGHCFEHEQVPFKALDGLVDALSRLLSRLPCGAVAELLPRNIGALTWLFPVLQQAEAVRAAPGLSTDRQDPIERKRAAFAALRELLQRLADRHPLALFIDDLQWGDLDSVALLLELLRAPAAPGLLLVVAYRTEEQADAVVAALRDGLAQAARPPGVEVCELRLAELSTAAAAGLGRRLLGAHAAGGTLAESIAEEAGGSPFFIEELVRFSCTEGAERERPLALDAVIRARRDTLPTDARRLLELVCVAGQPLARGAARRALGPTELPEPQALAVLQRGRLLRLRHGDREEELLAYHDRIRETVTAALTEPAQRAHHLCIARAIEDTAQGSAQRLSFHFLQAGEPRLAARYAVDAALQAYQALAFDQAAALCREALCLPDLQPTETESLRACLAKSLAAAGRPWEAAQSYLDEARHLHRDLAQLRRRLAIEQLFMGGYVEEGQQILTLLLREVGLPTPRAGWSALLALVGLRLLLFFRLRIWREGKLRAPATAESLLQTDICASAYLGMSLTDFITAAVYQTLHLLRALSAGEPKRLALGLAHEALLRGILRGRQAAARLLQQAAVLAERTGDANTRSHVRFTAAMLSMNRGEWRDASALMSEVSDVLGEQSHLNAWHTGHSTVFRMACLLWRGELRQLAAQARAALREAQARGQRLIAFEMQLFSLWEPLAADDQEEAALRRDAALAGAPQSPLFRRRMALLAQLQVALYRGETRQAWELLTAAWPEYVASGALRLPLLAVPYHHVRGLVALSTQSRSQHAVALAAARWLRRQRTPWGEALGAALLSGLYRATGRELDALAELESAERGLRAAGMALYAACARWRRGAWLGGSSGQGLREEATAWMSSQGIRSPARMSRILLPD